MIALKTLTGLSRLMAAAAVIVAIAGTTPAAAMNASDRSANHLNHDRWAKTEPHASHSGSDDEDDDGTSTPSPAPAGGAHHDELNGHLHIHNW